jgi:3-oxoacyl-[acyl-carrier protein] reductase
VCSRKSIHEGISTCTKSFGGLDILVNNAGIMERGKIESVSVETWNNILEVNLTGTLLCSQMAIPHMKLAGGGVILNASSVSAKIPDVGLAAYCVSKAGVEVLTRIMAAELAPYNIRVNAYAPGVTQTQMTHSLIARRGKEKLKHIALKEFGAPDDIAELAVFLCSARSRFITGSIVSIDGGTMIVENPWKAWE